MQRSPLFLIFLLWCAGLGAAGQFAKIAVPFDLIGQRYPDSGAGLGLLLSMISFAGIVLGMTAGILVARHGFRRLLVLGLIVGALCSAWQATMPGFAQMLTSRIVEGLSHLVIVVAAPTLIAQIAGDRLRGPAMTLWSTFFAVAFSIVAWLGLPMAEAYGIQLLFLIHGGIMATLAALVWWLLDPDENSTRSGNALNLGEVLGLHLYAYRSASVAAPAVGWLFYTLTFVSLVAILPGLLPEGQRAAVVGLMPVASIGVSLLIVTPLLRYWPAVRIVMAGFALSAAVLGSYWLGVPPAATCIALFAVLGLVQGASFAAIPQLNASARDRALANGAMAQMGNLGNTLGTPVLMIVLQSGGTAGMLAAVILFYAAGIVLHIWMQRRRMLA
ncbi:MFS transporter [Ruegeria marina]|uniref:Predicted arabinose efflux permease, MFS family n=1 Tax=Ruegeria marina TaxID=639004 RepID=A0A1G7A502_9RHOB|nr:MFS transporter [Ruegeria marina]SDE09919.1 Predicted arabinose efflux permease, MFS family [Ruegeria marina]